MRKLLKYYFLILIEVIAIGLELSGYLYHNDIIARLYTKLME